MKKFRRQQIAFLTAAALLCGTCACGGDGTGSSVILPEETQTGETTADELSYLTAPASSMEVDKEETVQVKADANGSVTDITVEARLRHGSESTIADLTTLEAIKNTEGDEEYTQDANTQDAHAHLARKNLIWENHGEDIHYEGTTDAELPVGVTVTYLLDGEEISPEKLAGKSGRLTIRFNYDNHTAEQVEIEGKTYEVCVPFMAMSVLTLDEDIFSNMETENGEVVSMDGTSMFIGYAYPGLAECLCLGDYDATDEIEIPSYTELTADVRDFKLEFTATIITRGTFEDLDTDDLTDIDDLIDGCEDLADASSELVDGTSELKDGAEAFGDGLDEYTDGVTTLAENGEALLDGARAVYSGLETLNKSLSGVDLSGLTGTDDSGSTSALTGSLTALGTDYAVLAAYVSCSQAALEISGLTEEQKATYETVLNSAMKAVLNKDVSAGDVTAAVSDMGTQLTALQTALTQLTTSLSGLSQLGTSLTALQEGVAALDDGSCKLVEGLILYLEGVDALDEAGTELTDGYGELEDGIGELADGFAEFDEEGIRELTDLAEPGLRDVTARLRALKEADARYTNFSGILPDSSGSVTFIIETEGIE